MTYFVALLIIPEKMYDGDIKHYVINKMIPYDRNLKINPYIYKTREELDNEFQEYRKSKYYNPLNNTLKKYCAYYDYNINDNYEVLSDYNLKSLYDNYTIANIPKEYIDEEIIKNNSIKMMDLLDKYENDKENVFYVIIDQNGELHKKQNYDCFGVYEMKLEDEEWIDKYEEILYDNLDNYFINITCYT